MNYKLLIYINFFWIFLLALNSCKKEDINTSSYTPPVTPVNPVAPVLNQPCKARLYDLDITFNTSFEFIKDYNNPWDYGAPDPESYYDLTIIEGKGIIDSLGEFKIYISEYADTATLNNAVDDFYIYQGNYNPIYISGSSSINFKKLMIHGGGPFEGNFNISSGSVKNCDQSGGIYYSPLTVTGILDSASMMVSITIKGKAYF
jgi:hypothetical protein